MAIDAIITSVRQDGPNLILDLEGREEGRMPGQARMTIENFTHRPVAGQMIWGGADTCHIEPCDVVPYTLHYRRNGYTTLVENTRMNPPAPKEVDHGTDSLR